MAGKNKGGREVRKPKMAKKPTPSKDGSEVSRAVGQAKQSQK